MVEGILLYVSRPKRIRISFFSTLFSQNAVGRTHQSSIKRQSIPKSLHLLPKRPMRLPPLRSSNTLPSSSCTSDLASLSLSLLMRIRCMIGHYSCRCCLDVRRRMLLVRLPFCRRLASVVVLLLLLSLVVRVSKVYRVVVSIRGMMRVLVMMMV
jgi:hypothetical protein